MAEKNAGGVSIRIGLALSQLETDFLTAEQTIKQGISTLNRQQNLIKLRMETDLAGLDVATDKAKIFEVQERSLNQLLEMQRDRLKLATLAFQDYVSGKNVNKVASKNLETAMERERLAVAKLEEQLKHLQAQKVSLDTSNLQSNIDKITAQIGNIRIKAEIDTSKLQNSGDIFETQKIQVAALTKELELQRQKLIQLREAMYQSAKTNGASSVQTLNIKSNVLKQIQEINQLETKLKELSNTNISLQIRADSIKQIEQTIHDNITRLNARLDSIRVKTEIDTSKLGTAASEFDKAKIHVQGLNRELDLQNQKLAALKQAFSMSVSINGLNNVKTINLQTDIQRQIQEIDRLKAKINELNKIEPPKTNNLLSGYQNIKGNVAGKLNELTMAFSNLQGSTSSADTAITATLGLIDSIPKSAGLAAAALVGVPIVFKGIENSIVDLIKASASAGDSVYVMSRGFQMSIADTGKFTAMCKTAGVEVNDLASTIKRTQQQIIRGGDNSKAAQWLQRYGESAFDASGHLKDMNEMTLTLNRALKKAQAEGNGMAFILGTMRGASADAITAIEDAEGVYQQAAGLVKNGLANPTLAHDVQGNLNAMNLQASFMKASFESALLPVANEIIPRLTERMGKFTTLIKDNKDVILDLGRDLAAVWGSIEKTVDKVNEGLSVLAKLRRDNTVVRDKTTEDIVKKYKDDSAIKHADDLLKAEISNGDYSAEDKAKLSARSDLYNKELRRAQEEMKDLWRARREKFAESYKPILEKYKDDKEIKTMTDLLNKLTVEEKELIQNDPSEFFGSLQEKVGALNLELQKLRETSESAKESLEKLNASSKIEGLRGLKGDTDITDDARSAYEEEWKKTRAFTDELYKITHNDFENRKFELDKWHAEMVNGVELSEKERAAIEELYAAKSEQIEQERADKLAEIRESITSADKTALQQKLDSIEKEKETWLKAGMEESEAEELAQQQKANYIKGINQQLSAELNSLSQNDLQRKLSQIEQEKQAWIDKGADEEKTERLAQQKIRQAHEETESKLNEIRQSVAALDNSELENRLAAIEHEKNAWIQAGMEKAEAEELAQQKISKTVESYEEQRAQAAEQYAEQVANAQKQYIEQVQAAREEADRKNRQEINDAFNILKSEAEEFNAYMKSGYRGLQEYRYNQLLKSGVNPEYLKKMTPELMDEYRAAQEKTDRSFLPNWNDRNEPRKVERPKIEIPDILMKVPPSFDKVSAAAANAAESLDNLARSAGYKPTDGINDLRAYEQPDGSTFITNNPQDLEDSIKNTASALNELPTSIKDTAEKFSNIEPPQIPEIESMEMPEIDTSVIAELVQSLSEMPEVVQAANESLNELSQAVLGVMEQISAIEPEQMPENNLSEIEQNLSQLPTVIQTVTESLSELPTAISGLKENLVTEVSQLFSPMGETLSEVTVRINDFATSLGDFLQRLTSGGTTEQRTPVEVTNNISIEEAHAWDYDHIQELAERVADVLKPEILSAIGGGDNSY